MLTNLGTEVDASACQIHTVTFWYAGANDIPDPERECACVDQNTTYIIENLSFDSTVRLYGRVVNRAHPLAWPRCKVCKGSGVDRRP